MTPLEQRFCLIGRRIVIAAAQKAYPDRNGLPRDEFWHFAEHSKQVEKMTEFVEAVCKLLVQEPIEDGQDIAKLVHEWRLSLDDAKELRRQVENMHKSGEYAIGKSLVEAIKLAHEKSKS